MSGLTALERYAKLEASGWYVSGNAPRQEVILSFGARSLMISAFNEVALVHWPLASLRGFSAPGEIPLSIGPDLSGSEHVEVADLDMIAAILEVCPELYAPPEAAAPPPRRARWPWVVGALVLACLLALAVLLPKRLADVYMPEQITWLGEEVRYDVATRLAGGAPEVCEEAEGMRALATLEARLRPSNAPPRAVQTVVVDAQRPATAQLPDGTILVSRGMIAAAETPEELAALIAHKLAHQSANDPFVIALGALDWSERAMLWAGLSLSAEALDPLADALAAPAYAATAQDAAHTKAQRMLREAGLPYTLRRLVQRLPKNTFLAKRGPTGLQDVTLERFEPALRDRDWLALQNICDVTKPLRR